MEWNAFSRAAFACVCCGDERISCVLTDPPSYFFRMPLLLRPLPSSFFEKQPMGQCLIGIQIFPAEKAAAQPAGIGRTEPNDAPFLPPPNGRLKFGWNPISMLSQLLGPRLCCILCCCLCIALVIVSLIFLQPLWNLIIALAVN